MLSTLKQVPSLWAGKILNSWLPTDNFGSYYKELDHSKRKWGNFVSYILVFTETVPKNPFTDGKCSTSFGWKSSLKETVCLWGSAQSVLQPFIGSVRHSLQCRHWRAVLFHGSGIRILVRRNSCSAFEVNISNVTLQVVSAAFGLSQSCIREYLTK
jgi:hypothetical protein